MIDHRIDNTTTGKGTLPLVGHGLHYTNLDYLRQHTKSNAILMRELIKIYLEQTQGLIDKFEKARQQDNWADLAAAAHKIKPSLQMMGLRSDYVAMAKELEDAARQIQQQRIDAVKKMTCDFVHMIKITCTELQEELVHLKQAG